MTLGEGAIAVGIPIKDPLGPFPPVVSPGFSVDGTDERLMKESAKARPNVKSYATFHTKSARLEGPALAFSVERCRA